MKTFRDYSLPAVAAVLMVFAVGCGRKIQDMPTRLGMLSGGQLNAVIRKNIEAMGGIDAWSRGQRIKAQAIASVFEPDGSRSLLEQQHVIAIDTAGAFSVLISNDEPIGKSTEQLTSDGKVIRQQQIGDSVVSLENQEELDGAKLKLSLEAHAMTGAAGLLQDGLSLRYVGLERKGGRLHHKIEATGQMLNRDLAEYKVVDDLLVAWVDAETYLFDRLLLRYQLPSKPDKFGYIAVNVGDYQRAGQNLLLPRLLEFVPSDEHQQFSEQLILVVEFKQLQVSQGDKVTE